MQPGPPRRRVNASVDVPARHRRAWLLLVGALAVHVADEASTGFLELYNPIAHDIRSRLPWLPVPTFTFGVWLAGLGVLVAALALLAPRHSAGLLDPERRHVPERGRAPGGLRVFRTLAARRDVCSAAAPRERAPGAHRARTAAGRS
jgi:hypothetical protein